MCTDLSFFSLDVSSQPSVAMTDSCKDEDTMPQLKDVPTDEDPTDEEMEACTLVQSVVCKLATPDAEHIDMRSSAWPLDGPLGHCVRAQHAYRRNLVAALAFCLSAYSPDDGVAELIADRLLY